MTKVDTSVCLAILRRGLRNSSYILQSGQPANAYMNIDTAMLGDDYEAEDRPQYKVIEDLASQFIHRIQEIGADQSFDRLAFIDKGGQGPVGTIALSSLLVVYLKKEALFVRPYRNTIRSTIKGKSIEQGESILIVSDVATTGETIIKVAAKLWEVGAIVRGALVFFDQELGAKENLHAIDIELYSLLTRNEAIEESAGDIPLTDQEAKLIHEFGVLM